jgi:hypothetical protein
MLASIFEAAGAPPGVIGTIGIFVGPRKIYSGLTTPESLDFESALADMERAGVRRVAAETSGPMPSPGSNVTWWFIDASYCKRLIGAAERRGHEAFPVTNGGLDRTLGILLYCECEKAAQRGLRAEAERNYDKPDSSCEH